MTDSTAHIPRVAIVLLCYNNKDLVQAYLPIIKATIPQHKDYHIAVVNNAGNDGTDTWVEENYPEVQLVQIAINKGFTNGYVESLPEVKAKNYVLISADVEPAENWLLPALDLLESDDSIAAVQPKVMSWDKKDTFEYAGGAGGYIDYLGYPFCRGRLVDSLETDQGQFDDVRPIFWASGCCLFIKSEAWEKSGGFDNDFFAHMEEIDLCWRLRQMGYEILFEPKSVVYHMGGSVIKYGSPAKTFQNFRNNGVLLIKNLPLSTLLWLIPLRVLLDWAAMLNMFKNGDFKIGWAVIRAQWSLFSRFGFWCKKRKTVSKLRTRSANDFGVMQKSLVWAFFAKGNRTFSQLNWDPVSKKDAS